MYFKYFLQYVIKILFPPSKEELLVHALTIQKLYTLLSPQHTAHTETLFRYKEPEIRALIWRTKYANDMYAARLLGTLVREIYFSSLRTPHIAIPIPLSRARLRERGFNQATRVLAFAAEGCTHICVDDTALLRTHHRTPQTRLTRKERQENLKGVFAVAKPEKIMGADIILFDDVTTTGTTLSMARTALLQAGAKTVRCIAIARSW